MTKGRCRRNLVLTALLLLSMASPWAYAQTPELEQARALLKAGKASEAVKVLAPLEDTRAGDTPFDYLYGVAALEAGDPAKASVSLERVLIVDPNDMGARVDLARAYFALGDTTRARTEFNIAMAQNPPPAARATIEHYLARISSGAAPGGLQKSAYIDLTLGRDTNVNAATSQGQIFVPVFGFAVQLAPTSRRTPDNFASTGVGGELTYNLSNSTALFAGGDARLRFNQHADDFNYGQFDARLGVQQAFGSSSLLRLSGAGQHYVLDRRGYRNTTALNAEWRQTLSNVSQLSIFGSGNRIRYRDGAQTANDTDLGIFGVGYTHVLNPANRTSLSISALGGYERDVGQRIDGDRKLYGLRFGGQTGVSDKTDVFFTAGYQPSNFQTQNLIFSTKRKDRQTDAAIGAQWRIDRAWSLRPQLTYTRNASNVDINAYNRYEASLTLRRDFK